MLIVATIAAALLTACDRSSTVRTAPPPATTTPLPAPGTSERWAPDGPVVTELDANGETWVLVVRRGEGDGVCLALEREGGAPMQTGCWTSPAQPIEAVVTELPTVIVVSGVATEDVTGIRITSGPSTSDRPLGVRDLGFAMKLFGAVVPAASDSVGLTATTAGGDEYHASLPLPIHSRVAVINGQLAPPEAAGSAPPPMSVSVPATSPPSTTVPPLTGPTPTPVEIVTGATGLHKQRFESAMPSGPQAVAVRFWGGAAPCDVLGRVDVSYSSTAVTVTLWSGTAPGAQAVACPQLAQYKEVTVPLATPLAGRRVVDGAA